MPDTLWPVGKNPARIVSNPPSCPVVESDMGGDRNVCDSL